MLIYQVLTRLWRNGKMSGFDQATFDYLRSLGVSHIWYTGIIRHSQAGRPYVKGNIGSPYSIIDYYDINPYLAENPDRRLEEFEELVRRTHESGLKVIIDFIPNHVSPEYNDSHGGIKTLHRCDYDWTDTDKIDYACPDNWDRMLSIVRYWASKGVDGFRCDMAELVPLEFWRYLTLGAKQTYPGLEFIAEVYEMGSYDRFIYTGGFDILYDKSGLYDTLRGIVSGEGKAWDITGVWQKLGPLQPHMLNFLENHDEQRLASPWFAGSAEKGFAALAVSALFYPCPFMLYFGQEIGEAAHDGASGRTSIFDEQRHVDPLAPLSENQQEVLDRYREVLNLREELKWADNFDLCYFQKSALGFDMRKHFAFIRHDSDHTAVVFANFSDKPASVCLRIPPEAPGAFGSDLMAEAGPWDFTILKK
ncbi:MAG: hypothetical protein J5667_06120 [Bacteroidales bacterium]|nr:hypothetical protein [Bacteroidales bacterium]